MALDWPERVQRARRRIAAALQCEPVRWLAHQIALARYVRLEPWTSPPNATVAGVDVHYAGETACATIVVLRSEDWNEARVVQAFGRAPIEYEYGFLAFRELPLIFEAAAQLQSQPDAFFYDGNGILHPRGLGAASHFGVLLGVPTIGVSKNVRDYRPQPPLERGAALEIENGRGALVVTNEGTKPVCVSPGHRMDLHSAMTATLAWSRYRIPEPIRRSDQRAREALRERSRLP